jgi:inorganic pyrophosphatase
MPNSVEVVIEVPRGSRNKYEYDPTRGVMRLDRRLPGSFAFPADYGYIPDAVGSDNEPLDALVLTVEPAYPGVWVRARPIGVFWIETETRREAKILCVPEKEPAYEQTTDIAQLPSHLLDEIENFFDIYRTLDAESQSRSGGHEGAAVAERVLTEGRRRPSDAKDPG